MKGIMKKVTAILMAMVMVVSCIMVNGTKAEAGTYVVNPAEYSIRYLLSNYQIYVKGDLTTGAGGHQMGSLIVGGNASLGNSFGNVSIAPTYLNHISKYGYTAYDLKGTDWEEYGNLNVYYTSSVIDPLYSSPMICTKVPSYIDFDKAFTEIAKESKNISQGATSVTVESDGYIYLDVSDPSESHNYIITEAQFLGAKAICFKGTDKSLDAFRYVNNPITITIEGMASNDIKLDFNGEGPESTYTVGVKWDTNEDPNVDAYESINGALKGLSGSMLGDQLNPYGTNLLWNFPNVTKTVHAEYLAGHLVAPQAAVKMTGGNFEGGFIAASADIDAEGHFYPYYEIGKALSDAPMNPSISGSDFIITVAEAQTVNEAGVIDLSDAQYYATTGADGDNSKVSIDNVAGLNAVTEPGEVQLTISDASGSATAATSVDITATVVQYKETKEYNGSDNQPVLVQIGANDFEMSIAQAQAYIDRNPSEDAANTMLKVLANAVAIDGGQTVDRSQIYIASQNISASEGVYDVQFAYNNTYVTVKVTVKDDGPTDNQSDKTDVPGVNLTGNDFIVQGGSATLTEDAFITKAEVTSKNTDGSTRTDITVDVADLAALNTKIKHAEATEKYPVKVYSGGVTTTIYVTVEVGYPYIAADDFIISTTDVSNITDSETTIKDLSDAKKISSSNDTTGDNTVIDVDDTDATELKAQTTPGLVEIVVSDTSAMNTAPNTTVIATVVDDTDEHTDANTGKKIVIGANNFNISEEELAAVTSTRSAEDADANKRAADTMVKILANAVATDDGDAVSRDDIKVVTFALQSGKTDVYDVMFTYTDASGNTVTAQVEAYVKDAGPTDGENDVTDVPSINLTANDFSVEGGSAAFTADTFKTTADVEANYNTGESIDVTTITVNQADLEALNQKIANKETGEYTVDVSVGGVTTTVTVTVTDRYPHIKANDFIVSLENTNSLDDTGVKNLSDSTRYDNVDGTVQESNTQNVDVDDSDLTEIKNMTEPGTVDVTLTDTTSGNTADPKTVKATVVDKTNTADTEAAIIIGANHYYLSVEQAQAIVDARTGNDADKFVADALNKALSNVVATNSGAAVDVANISVNANAIKAEKGEYDVTFTYQGQSVTVTATVQDAGSTDDKDTPTVIPAVSLTGNDLRVKGGGPTFADEAAFITAAEVVAQNLDGSSRDDVDVDYIDLAKVNDMITQYTEGAYPVSVTSGGVTTTIMVTVYIEKTSIDADDFIISVTDAKNVNDASDVKDLSDAAITEDSTGDASGLNNVEVSAEDIAKLSGVTEPGTIDGITLTDKTGNADDVTVKATIVDVTGENADRSVVIGANNFNISKEQAQAVVDARNGNDNAKKAAADAMLKILANAVATDNGIAVTDKTKIAITINNIDVAESTDGYDVTFAYTGENGDTVYAPVKAFIKDAGTTDGASDPTDVPSVNLTADDFTIAAGSGSISETTFKTILYANVEANNQDGSSIPLSQVDVDNADLQKLNNTIATATEDTDVPVKVSVGGVSTTVTVTVTANYPKVEANDFIISVEDAKNVDADDVKDLSDTNRYETSDDKTNSNPSGMDDVTIPNVTDLSGRTEPGTVELTVKDTNTTPAAPVIIKATVVDATTTSTDGSIVIGANNFNVTIAQAEAIQSNPTDPDVLAMVKTLANAVATDDGEKVEQEDIDIQDVKVIKAENGDYLVTFTYDNGTDEAVAVQVTATVKDDGAGDDNADQTQVPAVNVTGNDFTVKVNTPEITEEAFMTPSNADVEANYNDGSSVPSSKIDVNDADLKKLNDAIAAGETGTFEVDVTADGETTTIKVTVTDEKTVDDTKKEVIGANNFEIKLADYDKVVNSKDELVKRASALAYDSETRADVAIASATVKNPEKKAGTYEVTFATADGTSVTVDMTIKTTPSITANDFNISIEQAQTIVNGKTNADVMDMVKELANAVAKDDDVVVTDTSKITVDASKVKAAKGSYDVIFTYDGEKVTVKATVKDNSAADGDADKTDVPEVNLTANDFTIAAGSDPLTDKTFNEKADTEAKKNDGTPVTDIKVDQADLAKVNEAIANGTEGDYQVKVTAGNDTAVVTVTVTKQDDIKGVDQVYEISNPKDVPQDLAEGRTVKTVNVNGKDIPASAYTVENGKLKIKSNVFKDYKEGTYPVVITYKDGSKHTFNVKVIPYDETTVVKKVPTFHMQKDLGVGKKFKLNLVGMSKTAVKKFKSSNKKIATIDKNGVIKGKKKGKCKITATVIQNGSYYTVKIDLHVKKSMKMYNLKKAALQKKQGVLPEFNVYKRVVKGKKTKLKFTNVEKNAKITYKSSNKKVATVSKKGVIKGKKKGFTVVTAKIQQNGFTYYTKLIVRVDDGTKNKQLKKYLK